MITNIDESDRFQLRCSLILKINEEFTSHVCSVKVNTSHTQLV